MENLKNILDAEISNFATDVFAVIPATVMEAKITIF